MLEKKKTLLTSPAIIMEIKDLASDNSSQSRIDRSVDLARDFKVHVKVLNNTTLTYSKSFQCSTKTIFASLTVFPRSYIVPYLTESKHNINYL